MAVPGPETGPNLDPRRRQIPTKRERVIGTQINLFSNSLQSIYFHQHSGPFWYILACSLGHAAY